MPTRLYFPPDLRATAARQTALLSPGSVRPLPTTIAERLRACQTNDRPTSLPSSHLPGCAGVVAAIHPRDYLCAAEPVLELFTDLGGPEAGFHSLLRDSRTQAECLHAVGFAWGMRYRRHTNAVIIHIWEEDYPLPSVHQALNFAAVRSASVLFVAQVANDFSPVPGVNSLAQVAIGYGIRAYQVPADNPSEIWSSADHALNHARDGRGPSLLELIAHPSP